MRRGQSRRVDVDLVHGAREGRRPRGVRAEAQRARVPRVERHAAPLPRGLAVEVEGEVPLPPARRPVVGQAVVVPVGAGPEGHGDAVAAGDDLQDAVLGPGAQAEMLL